METMQSWWRGLSMKWKDRVVNLMMFGGAFAVALTVMEVLT